MLVKQIDLKNRTIHLMPGGAKNNEGRVVKMTDEVYDSSGEAGNAAKWPQNGEY